MTPNHPYNNHIHTHSRQLPTILLFRIHFLCWIFSIFIRSFLRFLVVYSIRRWFWFRFYSVASENSRIINRTSFAWRSFEHTLAQWEIYIEKKISSIHGDGNQTRNARARNGVKNLLIIRYTLKSFSKITLILYGKWHENTHRRRKAWHRTHRNTYFLSINIKTEKKCVRLVRKLHITIWCRNSRYIQ